MTQGLDARPASTAFLARRPAPIRTEGLEVLVHEVMAAMTTEPWSSPSATRSVPEWPRGFPAHGWSPPSSSHVDWSVPSAAFLAMHQGWSVPISSWNSSPISSRRMLSWGRLGPASVGSTVTRSSSRSDE